MTKQPNIESVMTDIYTRNLWGSPLTRSGPTSTQERTMELCHTLPELFQSLGIESILDVGCGDFSWMKTVNLEGVEYLGVDIVTDLVENLQKTYTTSTIKFQKMNVLQEPPESVDVWFCRDFLNLLDLQQTGQFFSKFLESKSLYLALTTVEFNDADNLGSPQNSLDGYTGIQRMVDIFQPPFRLGDPKKILFDGEQWFRKRFLVVFSRDTIEQWWQRNQTQFMPTTTEVDSQSTADGTQDRNAALKSNILLKNYPIHGHTVLPS